MLILIHCRQAKEMQVVRADAADAIPHGGLQHLQNDAEISLRPSQTGHQQLGAVGRQG